MPIPYAKISPSRMFLIFLSALFLFRLLIGLSLPLSPQEAYYWVYSLHPDLSYFDHPPLVAYTILFFSTLFGPTVLAVRLGALLYAFGISWLLYLIGRDSFDERTGFWATLLMNFLPTFSINALIMTPDSPLLFFWCLAWFMVVRALKENRPFFYLLAGVSLGLALVSKYTALFFPLSLAIYFLISSEHRGQFLKWQLYLGMVLAVLVFSPVLWWNDSHHWASLAFQSTERAGEMTRFRWDELGAFLATQLGVLSPLIFLGMIWTIGKGIKRFWHKQSGGELLLLCLSLPMIFLFAAVATREWVKMNWLIPAYPSLLLLLTAYYEQRVFAWKGIYRGWAVGTWISLAVFFAVLHLWPFIPQIPVSGSTDTTTGWKDLADHVETLRRPSGNEPTPFIFSWGHKTAAELQFYLKGHPETYAQTVLGKKAVGYDYWFDPGPLKGRDALFIWSGLENFPDDRGGLLEKYFDRVEKLEPFPVKRGEKTLRTFKIYRCYGYKGYEFTRP
jgi:4-amino-4-deoxy-L-arabinose transferase-like glycosyltransferase